MGEHQHNGDCKKGCGGGNCGHGHSHAEEFQNTYLHYLSEIRKKGLEEIARRMGAELRDGALPVVMFGEEFLVSGDGITGAAGREPTFIEKVVLSRYLLLYPEVRPEGDLDEYVSYRDFKDSAPFVGGFKQIVELPIAKEFGGQYGLLKKACAELGGEDPRLDLGYDLARVFPALPEVPMMLLFNDSDSEFPACALLLFQKRAELYLDMESLAGLGGMLATQLASVSGEPRRTII